MYTKICSADIRNTFCSTSPNAYYFSLRNISAAQLFKTANITATIITSSTIFLKVHIVDGFGTLSSAVSEEGVGFGGVIVGEGVSVGGVVFGGGVLVVVVGLGGGFGSVL